MPMDCHVWGFRAAARDECASVQKTSSFWLQRLTSGRHISKDKLNVLGGFLCAAAIWC